MSAYIMTILEELVIFIYPLYLIKWYYVKNSD